MVAYPVIIPSIGYSVMELACATVGIMIIRHALPVVEIVLHATMSQAARPMSVSHAILQTTARWTAATVHAFASLLITLQE